MKEVKFKSLMYNGYYVDANILDKGIYNSNTPFLYDINETIETMILKAEKIQDHMGFHHISQSYFDNLKQCQLIDIFILNRDEYYKSDYEIRELIKTISSDLVHDLKNIQDKSVILYSDGNKITVEDLIDNIIKLTPLGIEHIKMWINTLNENSKNVNINVKKIT